LLSLSLFFLSVSSATATGFSAFSVFSSSSAAAPSSDFNVLSFFPFFSSLGFGFDAFNVSSFDPY